MRATDQREASLEQDARQPRLTKEADGPANTKTRERTEGAATAVQAMHGDRLYWTKGSRWPEEQLDQFRHDGQTSRST